ncbi:hypothetical protein PR202_ga22993 [Eleusine coracana subsp. coracana]|uniref:Uncharacterized protein n=1 Tax=Eleusine coracana subsp. coracana TaxID=191504 RepID=A0AAV5D450_ELECO|nr:hypothetical protein PR202_ga22993 [Eleusine coracana subsp. coracana]
MGAGCRSVEVPCVDEEAKPGAALHGRRGWTGADDAQDLERGGAAAEREIPQVVVGLRRWSSTVSTALGHHGSRSLRAPVAFLRMWIR